MVVVRVFGGDWPSASLRDHKGKFMILLMVLGSNYLKRTNKKKGFSKKSITIEALLKASESICTMRNECVFLL